MKLRILLLKIKCIILKLLLRINIKLKKLLKNCLNVNFYFLSFLVVAEENKKCVYYGSDRNYDHISERKNFQYNKDVNDCC